MKILIIEDEKAMGDLLAIKFKVEGFTVEHATSLKEAKDNLISTGPYNLILTDYLLPDGDLIDFLTELRAIAQTKNIPVILMTNYVEDLNMEKLKSLGVVEVVVKYQIVPAQMVEKAKKILEGITQPAQAQT